ncbi:RES domain-containing protein [Altericroceibacterium spongiae]|uniref:RES domain-containing protein n=1 Tax=Altericroceibacterium spongiae TaxID=2320269 RepID=A0A420EE64_9SPHN|nr:RES family NAD+ phosphorylase [Altericroceibacterium spongiae]RKF18971.1 RES domain-containing protein [Altericroceibacterium spongiae]
MTIPQTDLHWHPCYRIIPSRFPPIALFEDVADPEDLEAVYALEALTNDRLREEAGNLRLVPPEDRVSGPGTSPVMAAFTHLNPLGDRFTDGTYGVFYAGRTLATAIAETRYHRACFLAATAEPAQDIDMRVYAVNCTGTMHDIRGCRAERPELYHPEDYGASQNFAARLRDQGADGIVYDSVRFEAGECVAVFRPRLLSHCRQERHLCYVWDGKTIRDVYEKRMLDEPGG